MSRPLGIDDLLAREEIRDTLLRYARGVDRCDPALMASCYHPDATDDHGSFVGAAVDFVAWVTGERSRRYEATTHFLGSPRIQRDGDRAGVETPCIAHHLPRPDESGERVDVVMGLRYLDRFERRGGSGWRIEHRTAVFDWTYTIPIDPALTRPFPPLAVRGHRGPEDPSYGDALA